MKKAYFQGTSDPKTDKDQKDTATSAERKNRDVRNQVFFRNYDYTQEDPNETSPGGGLYNGPMSRFRSVKDFLETKRKQNSKLERNSDTRLTRLERLAKEIK